MCTPREHQRQPEGIAEKLQQRDARVQESIGVMPEPDDQLQQLQL
jgi:hypothetical protein